MERQVILLGDLIDVFAEELGHVLEAVDQPGPGSIDRFPNTKYGSGCLLEIIYEYKLCNPLHVEQSSKVTGA